MSPQSLSWEIAGMTEERPIPGRHEFKNYQDGIQMDIFILHLHSSTVLLNISGMHFITD